MNEQIEKLAELSGFKQDMLNIGIWYSPEFQKFAERFAELIVRECVRYFNEDYTRDFDTLWREDLSRGIKEHFGVEE